jgi:hypothetical protein
VTASPSAGVGVGERDTLVVVEVRGPHGAPPPRRMTGCGTCCRSWSARPGWSATSA